MINQMIKRPCRFPGERGIGLLKQRVVDRPVGFLQRIRPSLIQQFPDYCEVRADRVCGLIVDLSQDADNYVQAHSEVPYQ